MAWLWVPFCAPTVSVDLDDGGIHHGVFHVWFIREGIEYAFENVGFTPVAKPAECRAPVAKRGGQVTPWAARAHNPKHGFNEQPVVSAAATGIHRLSQTMRFYLRPLGVCQYKTIHPKRESHSRRFVNPHRP